MTQAMTLAVLYSLDLPVQQMKEEEAKETRRDVVEQKGIGIECEGKCLGVSRFFPLPSSLSATQSTPETIIKVPPNLPILAVHRHPKVFTNSPKGGDVVM